MTTAIDFQYIPVRFCNARLETVDTKSILSTQSLNIFNRVDSFIEGGDRTDPLIKKKIFSVSSILFSAGKQKKTDAYYMKLAKNTKVNRQGNSPGSKVIFKLITRENLTAEDVEIIQEKKGYHPCGYGGPWDIQKIRLKKNIYTWSCSASCD